MGFGIFKISPMKILALSILLLLLTGCQWLNDLRNSILQKTNKTVEDIGYQYEKTKMSVEEKAQEVERAAKEVKEAAKEVKEAVDAVKKVGE